MVATGGGNKGYICLQKPVIVNMFRSCFIAAATETIITGTIGFKMICNVYVNNMWEIT